MQPFSFGLFHLVICTLSPFSKQFSPVHSPSCSDITGILLPEFLPSPTPAKITGNADIHRDNVPLLLKSDNLHPHASVVHAPGCSLDLISTQADYPLEIPTSVLFFPTKSTYYFNSPSFLLYLFFDIIITPFL